MAGIWALGRKVLAPRQLRWVLVAMATSKLFLWQAIQARMYGILEVEASLATLAYLGLITGRLSARAAGSTLFAISLAGIFTHYFYFFLLMAIALHYVFLSGRFRLPMFLGFAVAPGLIFAALWGPMWWSQVRSDRFDQEKVVNLPPTKHMLIVTEYFGNRGLAVALPGVVVLALMRRRGSRYRLVSRRELGEQIRRGIRNESFRAVATIWLVCMVVSYLVGLKTGLYKGLAVSILTLLPFILMVTLVFARCGDAMLRCALALTLLAVTLASDLRRYQMSRDSRSDRAWVRRIIERSKPGDSVVCCTGNFFPLVDYYLRSDAVGAADAPLQFPRRTEPASRLVQRAEGLARPGRAGARSAVPRRRAFSDRRHRARPEGLGHTGDSATPADRADPHRRPATDPVRGRSD